MIEFLKVKANLLAFVILILFFTLSFLSITGNEWLGGSVAPASLTADESVHLTSGYYSLKTNTMFLNPEHPPLAKDIAALPLLFINPTLPSEVSEAGQLDGDNVLRTSITHNEQYLYASKFLLHPDNNFESIVLVSRASLLIVNTILIFSSYYLIRRSFGKKIGIISLFLLTTTPTIIGHIALTNTDILSSNLTLITLLLWGEAYRNNFKIQRKHYLLLILATSSALLSKFSAFLIVPALLLYLLIKAKLYNKSKSAIIKDLQFFAKTFFLISLAVLFWYLLHTFRMKPDDIQDAINHEIEFTNKHYSDSFINLVISFAENNVITRALYTLVLGIVMVYWRLNQSIQSITFLGELYVDKSAGILYFPILFIAKSTIGFLSALVVSLLFSAHNLTTSFRRKIDKVILSSNETVYPILLYVIIFGFTALFTNLQIGIRHISPLILISSLMLAILINIFWHNQKFKVLILLSFALIVFELIVAFPKYINYYNLPISKISGGGAEIATDSNLDWGQSLYRLSNWIKFNNVDEIYVSTFNSVDLKAYTDVKTFHLGIESAELPPKGSYYAVSITYYQIERYRNKYPEKFQYLENNRIATVDGSVYIFKI